MWLQDKMQEWRAARAQRYLQRYPQLGVDVLRRDQDLASQAISAFHLEAAGGVPGRDSYQYPIYQGLAYGGRTPVTRTLPKASPWNLRRFSEYPPARRAINCLSNPILELPFAIVLRDPVGARRHDDLPDPTPEQQARIEAATAMFLRPNNDQSGREWLEMLLEDLIVLGACPFEVAANTSDPRPLFLWPVDAQSIRINMQWQPGADTHHYSQGKGFLYGSVGTSDEVRFRDEDLCYPRLNPRTSTPFGLGYLEVGYETVNAFIGAFQFATKRASNETPPYGLFLGENMTPEQVRRFQQYWELEIEGNGKIPILGGGRAPSAFTFTQGTGRDPLWLQWQEHIIRVIAMAFGLSPMRLALERDVNRSTAAQSSTDDWATIAPVANTLRSTFTQWLLWKKLGWMDLEFQWQVKSNDELRQAQILALEYEMNCVTVDEIRQIYEREPLPEGLGDLTKTAYEAAIGMLFRPAPPEVIPGQPAQPGQRVQQPGESKQQSAPTKRPTALQALSPFAMEDPDELSPGELAFLREVATRMTVADLEEAVAS